MSDNAREPPTWGFRLIALLTVAAGLSYLVWRYGWSINTGALWFSIPLIAAETYSLLDMFLFALMMWKPTHRVSPPPLEGVSVDVFIATYNEPLELVRMTAEAARRIDWPELKVYVLDDGAREEMRLLAAKIGVEYITRGEEWKGKPRHAKAGNVNNALMRTSGDFILILDADQIPAPAIVRRSIGYFADPTVAFVQTPQHFYNVPPGDPFGSDAPLFYGPILRGKDGWNAAFFCGTNALLRREALMQLGIASYVKEMERRFSRSLRGLSRSLARLGGGGPGRREAVRLVRRALADGGRSLRAGVPLKRVGQVVQEVLSEAGRSAAKADLESLASTLRDLARTGDSSAAEASRFLLRNSADLASHVSAGAETLGLAGGGRIDLGRSDEAIPVLPLATISVTEDMATAMRLHALGWKSVYHHEILAYGLAPEDLGSALSQRLRWAQGTIQVMVRENPLFVRGLSLGQRLQYFTTMYSYFSGFASLIYLAAPAIALFSGIAPVRAWSPEFFARLVPYLLLNRLMFRYAAWGIGVSRGEQYSLGLFSVWIRAVVGVLTGARQRFVVTPKSRQAGPQLRNALPQLLVILVTAAAVVYAGVMYALGRGSPLLGILVNTFWGAYNAYALAALVRAAVYTPPAGWQAKPPEHVVPEAGREEAT